MSLNKKDKDRIHSFIEKIADATDDFIGYPVAKDFDYQDLIPLIKYPLNNLGDPFEESTWKVDSRQFEKEVIEFFAKILNAPKDNWWGYVTNGGSEGNLYGLYLARELHPQGMTYFSQDTHYSVSKNLHLLNMRHIMIRSQNNGEIDYDDLAETLKIHRDVPAIIFANSGTTMTEAKDNIEKIKEILDELAISQYYIHVDAALCGGINPFLTPKPSFDFLDGADSISISGHKFFGSPIPCGVVVARKDYVNRIARSIAYIGSLDTTITGSRNGFTPVVLWAAIQTHGVEGFKKRVTHSLDVAQYAKEQLNSLGIKAWRNPNAITVVFPEVSDWIKEKWQLATADKCTHIICMPNISRSDIDLFISDIKEGLEKKQ